MISVRMLPLAPGVKSMVAITGPRRPGAAACSPAAVAGDRRLIKAPSDGEDGAAQHCRRRAQAGQLVDSRSLDR